jgi:hypothetical protein
MPLHDWSRVPAGLFHHFHQSWTVQIVDVLNSGLLPQGVAALVEQKTGLLEADVLAIEEFGRRIEEKSGGGVVTAKEPETRFIRRTAKQIYAGRANRIVLKYHLGRTIAVIELVSPGNKESRVALGNFVDKTIEYLMKGVHVLIVDLFPPTSRDPYGIHKVIWDRFVEEPFDFPEGKDRILASYRSGREKAAYIEPVTTGDALPDMPLFLTSTLNVVVPLEPTYQATWDVSPDVFKEAVETGVMPNPDAEE